MSNLRVGHFLFRAKFWKCVDIATLQVRKKNLPDKQVVRQAIEMVMPYDYLIIVRGAAFKLRPDSRVLAASLRSEVRETRALFAFLLHVVAQSKEF